MTGRVVNGSSGSTGSSGGAHYSESATNAPASGCERTKRLTPHAGMPVSMREVKGRWQAWRRGDVHIDEGGLAIEDRQE